MVFSVHGKWALPTLKQLTETVAMYSSQLSLHVASSHHPLRFHPKALKINFLLLLLDLKKNQHIIQVKPEVLQSLLCVQFVA